MMRKLVSVVLLCAACGDNLLVEEPDPDQDLQPGEPEGPTFEGVTPHLVPDICAVRTWPQIAISPGADLSVAPSVDGTTVFAADGGDLLGWHLDHAGELQTPKSGTVIRTGNVTAVAAAYVDGRMITASVADDGITIDLLGRKLSPIINLEKRHGQLIADVPVTHVREDRFSVIGDLEAGITGIRFAADWQARGEVQIGAAEILSLTAAPYREDTMVVWSTKDTCHLTRVAAERTSSRAFACVGGRLAMDDAARAGFLVYDDGERVMISDIRVGGESELANTRVLANHGTSPRILFTGSRFWVSYIDARDDVVIGYLDEHGALVSMAVEGTRPLRESHELALRDGHEVWLYAADGGSLGAQRFCLKAI